MARLDDGHPTIISFSEYPNVKLWEKSVTPPGVDGGDAVDTTTMRNTLWRTKNPRVLRELSDASFTAAYDTEVFDTIVAMVNENQEITVTFPDESTLTFWGWLKEFTPSEITEGEQPTANVVIVPGNQDNNKEEVAPVRGA